MIKGFEVEYQVLNKTYSVFLQSQAAVDELAAKLKERNRTFTVREVTVNEDTGRIEPRRECFYCSQVVTDEDEYTRTDDSFAHNVCIPEAEIDELIEIEQRCSQCGNSLLARACGPTHALLKHEILKRGIKNPRMHCQVFGLDE